MAARGKPDESGLTPQQRLACHLLVTNGGSQWEAYRDAGSKCTSENSLRSAASKFFSREPVKRYLDELMKNAAASSTKHDAEAVLGMLLKIANADHRAVYGENGTLLTPDKIPEAIATAAESMDVEVVQVKGVDTDGNETVTPMAVVKKINLSRTKAIEMLAKFNKMLTDRSVIDAGASLEELVMRSMGRSEGGSDD